MPTAMQRPVQVFVGFGFLMTFLRKYTLSAVGFNMILACVAMLLAVLTLGAAQQGLLAGTVRTVRIDLPLLIEGAFAAGMVSVHTGPQHTCVHSTSLLATDGRARGFSAFLVT
jgi:hypothetical protein